MGFASIFELTYKHINGFKSKQKQLQNKDVIVIDTVRTAKDYRRNQIAQTVYETLLNKYVIVSDQIQYEGAVNLWKRIIANNVVYIYDILEDKIISKVTTKTHENQIWSDDASKRRMRLVAIITPRGLLEVICPFCHFTSYGVSQLHGCYSDISVILTYFIHKKR